MSARLKLPRHLARSARRAGRQAWLASLPGLVEEAADLWSLTGGEPFQPGGSTSWVAPVRDAGGASLVLKIVWPHPEAAHEAAGLRAWAGQGAIRLHAARDLAGARAFLIERCRAGTALCARPETEQDPVIAALLRRLWITPARGHPFPSLRQMCRQWAGELEPAALDPLDPGLTRAGLALWEELPDSTGNEVLLCTDLHAGNVLAASREPGLVISPNPHVGAPPLDLLQHLLNCPGRLRSDPRGLARRMAGLAGLDPDRVLAWLCARCVRESPGQPARARVARAIAP